MNEFKGTPPPWALNRHGAIVGGKFHEYANGSAQSQVAMVVGSREVNEQEMKANAYLIAAAPDLFKELQLVLDYEGQSRFERWMEIADPSGDCESVQRQWLGSAEYEDFCDLWSGPIAVIDKALGK